MLLGVIKDPHRLDNYIAASQVGITLSSIVLGIYGQQPSRRASNPGFRVLPAKQRCRSSAVIVLIFLTTLQVIFGELLPKSIAIQYPERVALLTALPMRWSAEILLKPLIVLLNGSGRLMLKLLRVPPGGEHTHIHSPEEIVMLVQESHKSGLLDADERRMLQRFSRQRDPGCRNVVPRPRIVAAEVNQPLKASWKKPPSRPTAACQFTKRTSTTSSAMSTCRMCSSSTGATRRPACAAWCARRLSCPRRSRLPRSGTR
jgi:putative hemolysin